MNGPKSAHRAMPADQNSKEECSPLRATDSPTTGGGEIFSSNEDFLNCLLESSLDSIYVKDRNSRFIKANKILAKKWGVSDPAKMVGLSDFDIFGEELARKFFQEEQDVMASAQPMVGREEKQVWPNGDVTWVSNTKVPLRNAANEVVGIIGFARDITGRKRAEEALISGEMRFKSLFESMQEGVAVHRVLFDSNGEACDYEIVEVNPAFEKQTGIQASQVVGHRASQVYHTSEPPYLQLYADVARTANVRQFEAFFPPLEKYFEISVSSPRKDWFLTVFSDVSERKLQEAEIRRLNRLYAVLSEVDQAVVRTKSREELFQQICNIAIQFGDFKLAWIGRANPETHELVYVAAGEASEYLRKIKISTEDRPEGRGPGGTCFRTGQPCLTNDFANDPTTIPWRHAAARYGLASSMSLPIHNGGVLCAVLAVYSGEKDFFKTKEIDLMEEVAADISFALDHLDQEALRSQAEEAQAHSLSLLRATLEATAEGILVVGREGEIFDFNQKFTKLWGLHGSLLKSRIDDQVLNAVINQIKNPEAFLSRRREINDRPEESSFDVVELKDGRIFERQSFPQRIEGKAVGRVWSFSDITERRRTEEALKESEEKFRSLFTASREATLLADQSGIIDCNEAAQHVFGWTSREQYIGKQAHDFSPPTQPDGRDSRTAEQEYLNAAFATGSQLFEWTHLRSDGTPFLAEILLSRFELNGVPTLQVVIRDISWRKAAESQLRQLSRAVEQSPSAVVITDTKGDIEYVNPKFSAITGYSLEEAIGKNPRILKSPNTPPEVYKDLWETITAGREWRGEFQNKKKNGEVFWEAASICPITDENGVITHYLAVKEDITERKLMNEIMLRSQRMESIGSLAGGIAHDLNNILAPIVMATSMMHEEPIPENLQHYISTIEEAALRGADIIKQVLTFARGVEGQRLTFDLKLLLEQVDRMVRETFPKSIAFTISLPEDLWMLTGDLTQLHQVLLNLCVNARDAMPNGGLLTLTAENYEIGETGAFMAPEAKPGRYVKMTVADSGVGIPREIIAKIFDPFFTTKAPGKGTGLGLSTVIGIVRSHGGFVQVDSVEGKGSTFAVFIPASKDMKSPPVPRREAASTATGNGELILVVDDEPQILKIASLVLNRNHYKVITADNGTEALKVYRKHRKSIRLVLTDLMMPEMDGVTLARSLKKIDPELVIVVATGHGDESHETNLKTLGIKNLLQKPFSASDLLTAIREALHESRTDV